VPPTGAAAIQTETWFISFLRFTREVSARELPRSSRKSCSELSIHLSHQPKWRRVATKGRNWNEGYERTPDNGRKKPPPARPGKPPADDCISFLGEGALSEGDGFYGRAGVVGLRTGDVVLTIGPALPRRTEAALGTNPPREQRWY
jgi:hypothetical protein